MSLATRPAHAAVVWWNGTKLEEGFFFVGRLLACHGLLGEIFREVFAKDLTGDTLRRLLASPRPRRGLRRDYCTGRRHAEKVHPKPNPDE